MTKGVTLLEGIIAGGGTSERRAQSRRIQMSREVVVVSGVRTAIGDYGGALKDIAPTELAAKVAREAVARAKVDPNEVGHVVFGHVIHTEPKDMYLSRVAMIHAGLPHRTPAMTLNRLCGSGMQAIISAAQAILLGDADRSEEHTSEL